MLVIVLAIFMLILSMALLFNVVEFTASDVVFHLPQFLSDRIGPTISDNFEPTNPDTFSRMKMCAPMKENEVAEATLMGWPIEDIETGEEAIIGLIGVNAPQSNECGGSEAKTRFAAIAPVGATMQLIYDPQQGGRDAQGRLLRYVWYEGAHYTVNKKLVSEGVAYEYSFDKPYRYQAEMKQAQTIAQQNGLGVWNPASCNGQR